MAVQAFTIAAKCAPEEKILVDIQNAGLCAVELYTNADFLRNLRKIKLICRKFPFRYAIHAPNDSYEPSLLMELTKEINAEIVTFHDILWEDEWLRIKEVFKNIKARICVENTFSIYEPDKIIRRFGLHRCLDLEHLQMQCAGVYEEEFLRVIRMASHIHLTGYSYGSNLWHTNIHNSPRQGIYFLNLIKQTNYKGLVVSEARVSLQKLEEFKKLVKFFSEWEKRAYG